MNCTCEIVTVACSVPIAEVVAVKEPSIEEFAQGLASSRTVRSVAAKFRREIARHGYSSSSCGVFSSRNAVPLFIFRNWSKEWAEVRNKPGFPAASFAVAEASMIVDEGRRRMASFTWSDIRKERALTDAERTACDMLLTYGWCDGFVTPVHGPAGYLAIVSMASTERELDLSLKRRLLLQMIATLAHERSRIVANLTTIELEIDVQGITPRERECLRWVAAGKTDREIAELLSISATTAKFYIDAARTKLGAKTRAQAVARMVLSGLY